MELLRGIKPILIEFIAECRSVFDRYNVVSESDLDEAARKIEAGQKLQPIAV